MLRNFVNGNIRLLSAATGLLVAFAGQEALAGSFQLHEQSTTYLGTAYSGTASTAEDCSTGFYNPAGLTELKRNELLLSGIYFRSHTTLYNASAKSQAGATVTSSSTTHPKSNAVIPGVQASARLNDKWSVGLGVVTPFGLNTRYGSDSIARYMSTKAQIETIDITPSVGYKINDKFSIGAGFDAVFVQATLDQAVSVGLGEGYVQNMGHSWAYGYHLGVLFKPSLHTKMGLTYFSMLNSNVKGHTYISAIPLANVGSTFYAKMHLPDRLVYSITHHCGEKWTALADVEWTNWSRLEDLTLVYNTGNMSRITMNHKNSWRVALGGNYEVNHHWKVKAGLAWDESPVRTQYRIAELPDSNRIWLAVGLKYKINHAFSFDIAYAHLFFKNSTINQKGSLAANLSGNYKNSANMFGVQLTWSFL